MRQIDADFREALLVIFRVAIETASCRMDLDHIDYALHTLGHPRYAVMNQDQWDAIRLMRNLKASLIQNRAREARERDDYDGGEERRAEEHRLCEEELHRMTED